MLGYVPRCVFMVFAQPAADRVDELYDWYQVIHGPDALANGSFNALRRYRCVSNPNAPFVALWEGEWAEPEDAWTTSRRERELHDAGRIGDIPSADWASMTFTSKLLSTPVDVQPVRSMKVTVESHCRYHPDRDQSLSAGHAVGLDADDVGGPWYFGATP